jgi:predicted amidohydrolase
MKTVIACGQFAPLPGDINGNIERMRAQAQEAARLGARVLVLPELCLCGYPEAGEAPARAVAAEGPEINRVGAHARETGVALCFGFVERAADGTLRNSMAFVDDKGALAAVYRKVHLWVTEKAWAVPGESFRSFAHGSLHLGMWICYDTRFPEGARRLALSGATLCLVGSAWFGPEDEWELALRARAIDNGMFAAGAAVQGSFGSLPFHGASLIVDPHGRVLARARADRDDVIAAEHDAEAVKSFRARLPLLDDLRPDTYA